MFDQIEFSNKYLELKPFSKGTQKVLNWFVFFLAFPAIDLLGNSITFYLFLILSLKVGSYWAKPFRGKYLLILFLLLAFISSVLAPNMVRHPGLSGSIKILIQYFYWVFVAIFFITQKRRIDLIAISKWFLFGTLIAIFCFYFYKIKFTIPLIDIHFGISRNSFVFNLLCAIPICFLFIFKTFGKKVAFGFMPFFLLVMLFTDGRSGAVLIFLQLVLISAIISPLILKISRIVVPVLGLLFIVFQTDAAQVYLDQFADDIEAVNPRFASLLRGEGEGDLSFDKSWLERKLMVQKGMEIFKEYPLRGVGPDNFSYYDSKLSVLEFSQFDRLRAEDASYFNARSAHNSYIQVLSEMGIFGLLLLIALLFSPLLYFLKKLFFGQISFQYLPFVSLLAITMHLYAITALTGAISWMIIGLAWGVISDLRVLK